MALKASSILIAYILLSTLSPLVIYCTSVLSDHVNPLLPYFSDIGDQPIESTLFTQCYVVVAAVLMLVVQIRFVYASQMLKRGTVEKVHVKNKAGLYAGYGAASGLFVVACFQESHAYFAHYLALLLYLLGSIVYFVIHADISKSLNSLAILRSILAALMCGLFVVFTIGYVIAMIQHEKPWDQRQHWGKEDGGYVSHLVSSASEWLLITLFHVYFLTFYKEFKSVMLTRTRIIVLVE